MTGKLTLLFVAVLLAAARSSSAQRFMFTGVPDADVLAFVQKLQKAVAAGDRAGVAGMVKYPLRVNHDAARHEDVASAAELLKRYDAVFTPSIRQAIVTETPAKLTGGRDGVAIKAGLVWISSACDKNRPPKCGLGVSSVNLHGEK
jgi:hypothetical protein